MSGSVGFLPLFSAPNGHKNDRDEGRAQNTPAPADKYFYSQRLRAAKASAHPEEDLRVTRKKSGSNKRTLTLRKIFDMFAPREK